MTTDVHARPRLEPDGIGRNRPIAESGSRILDSERVAGGKPVPTFPRPALVLGFDAEDRRALAKMAGGAAVIIPVAAWLFGGIGAAPPENLRLVPDVGPLVRAAPMVLAHLGVALTALGLGVAVLAQRKGTRLHKLAGRLWAALTIGAAVTGILVEPHRFTAAHGAALFVFWMIPMVIVKARNRDLRGHRRTVAYLLIAMVVVSGLSLAPGHLLHGVFFAPSL